MSALVFPPVRLSICIATYNRAQFIGATLESILGQVTDECEVVVLDGASTDDTQVIVQGYAEKFCCLRYIRQEENGGIDKDFDRAVTLARGEYCWLMSDDDLIKPGGVGAVRKCLRDDLSLLIVNVEFKDHTMTKVLQHQWIPFKTDRLYPPDEMDRLFVEVSDALTYIGNVVIKRSIWLERDRERYYGSLFIHAGVIFQEPLPGKTLVLAAPVVSYRRGNTHTFSPQVCEIAYVKWPDVVRSFGISESAKASVYGAEPWRSSHRLLLLRALGRYSLTEYRRWVAPRVEKRSKRVINFLIAMLPCSLLNLAFVLYYSLRQHRAGRLQAMKESAPNFRNWRVFGRNRC